MPLITISLISLARILSGQITTLCPDLIASCINFTISLFRGSLSNINIFCSASIKLDVVLKLESPEATQLNKNRESIGPSTILTGLVRSTLSKPYVSLSVLSLTRMVTYLSFSLDVSNARPDTAISSLYWSKNGITNLASSTISF